MTWQPAPSIPLASQPSSWRRQVSWPSIPGCCPPISFSVCLVFSLLALCPAGLSWQALKILLCARTISVRVVLLWSRGLRGVQWLAEFCFAPLRWRCGLCSNYKQFHLNYTINGNTILWVKSRSDIKSRSTLIVKSRSQ